MNNNGLVKLSNFIGIVSTILLVYWVFIFISTNVFGLVVFKEALTDSFYLSVIGILALMAGSLIMNVMFNLTRIADKHNQDDIKPNSSSKKLSIAFALSFPIILGILFWGDYLTSLNREKMLILSAKSIIENDVKKSDKLLNYSFDQKWISETIDILDIYSKTDENFPNVSVIVLDSIDGSKVYLGFKEYYLQNDTIPPLKKEFLEKTDNEERNYLNDVFSGKSTKVWFKPKNGNYELFYPYLKNGKKIVLYFSDYSTYRKTRR